jgi:hypothetical protein
MLNSRLQENDVLRYTVSFEPVAGTTEKMAVITLLDEGLKKIQRVKLKVLNAEELHTRIDNGTDFNLSEVYINHFSLSEYRKLRGLKEHDFVTLKNFNAHNVFFDCELITDFSYAKFEGNSVLFSHSVFGNGFADFTYADFGHASVGFEGTRFSNGTKNFQSVKFGDGDISFNSANFGHGDLIFADASFSNGNVDFKNTVFGDGVVDFKFAKFKEGNISFERARFGKGKKDFKNVEFGGGRIDLRRVEFNDGDISFEGAEFGNGKVNFRGSLFGVGHKIFDLADFTQSEVNFDNVDFGSGSISFFEARANNISFNACSFNCFTDFRFSSCKLLNMANSVVRDIIDMVPESGKGAIEEINIVNTRIIGRIFINWRENSVYNFIYNQKNSTYFQKAEQFRILKENFRVNGQYEDEDDAYVEFKRCEAKANLGEGIASSSIPRKLLAYLNYYFQRYVFDYVGRYATSPVRVLVNGILTILTFGVLYHLINTFLPALGSIESTLPANINHCHDFWNSLYYSAITFFTIGYGDYFPVGFLKFAAAFEGFSGVFLMSYFTVAFVRKILR